MPKFSIIVPVYNVEQYLDACLKSIQDQTYIDFEVIIVNDGTKDHSQDIIDTFIHTDKRFSCFMKENGGQSSARNLGIKKSQGTYMIFVDGDDMITPDLLQELSHVIRKNNNVDIIRYQTKKVDVKTNEGKNLRGNPFSCISGEAAFESFLHDELFDSPCLYAFRTCYWNKFQFQFTEGRIHEDFGLIPYVIIKAKTVIALSYYGYLYMERTNSVMTNPNNAHLVKRMTDMFFHYDYLKQKVITDHDITPDAKRIFYSFLSNAILGIGHFIPRSHKKAYKKQIKERHVWYDLRSDTFMRLIKKMIVKYQLSLYIQFFIRKGR